MKTLQRAYIFMIAGAMACNAFAALDLPVKTVNGVDYYYYEVKPKESIYSLTKKIGVSRADIMRCNPAAVDGLRPKQVLLFPVSEFGEASNKEEKANAQSTVPHEVCPEEVSDPEVIPAVPLVPSTPVTDSESADIEMVTGENEDQDSEADDEDNDSEISVAVMLPFMLGGERQTKTTENYTEFYRGLLMAVDTMAAKNPDLHISVSAFDTEGSVDRVMSLLANEPELQSATYIIAPDDSLSIERIAEVADGSGSVVVNLFSVKNDAHDRHPSVYQANISHAMMYDKAVAGFIRAYDGYVPVLLTASDITPDKESFVTALRTAMDLAGMRYEEMTFSGELTPGMLSERFAPGTKYVFVPSAASREMITRIADPLTELRSRALLPDDVRLFGYPEWIMLRGEQARKLHGLHTAIYSRFASDADSYPVRRVAMRYEDWFGTKMANALPVYGLLGYDAGRWMIGGGEPYSGLQNSFFPGSVNSALYFVYFSPDGKMRVKNID